MPNGETQQQLSPADFAGKIRAKYPGTYDDLADAELTTRTLTKYPQYRDMVQSAPDLKTGAGMTEQAVQQARAVTARQPMKESLVPKIARGTTGALPVLGAVGGGILSGAAGLPSGPGAIATGALGSGLGAAGGEQARLLINRGIFGGEEPSPVSKEGLLSTGAQGLVAAGTEGLLGGLSRIGGKATGPKEWRAINDALKIRSSQVRLAKGEGDIASAYNIPGRSVSAAGITADELKGMTPFEQAARITPAWQAAGKRVSQVADAATKQGITFDVGSSVTKAIGKMPSPQMQERAVKTLSDTAEKLGIADWRAASPNQALKLRQALWDNLPSGYRRSLYGAVSGDLKKAVPEIVPVDQAYSELNAAIEATRSASQKFAATAQAPSAAVRAVKTFVRKALPYAVGTTGGVLAGRALRGLLEK